jgi:predicted nucleic acid-binding protein
MILLDTNVLVALVDERDRLHARAKRDLRRLSGPFAITSVVVSETCFLLTAGYLRQRTRFLIDRMPLNHVELERAAWPEVFDWLERYAEHEPDLCDAMLVVMANRNAASIWSYDKEFRTLWRGTDGKALRVVPATRRGG